MMVAFVASDAGAGAGFCQLDPVAFDPVNLTDRSAFGVDDFHMLANVLETAHFSNLLSVQIDRFRGAA
jgi:hypothetical protein